MAASDTDRRIDQEVDLIAADLIVMLHTPVRLDKQFSHPLGVHYEIDDEQRVVLVLRVWRIR